MSIRLFSVATLALAMFAGATALAAKDAKSNTHNGKVVSISDAELVMTSKDGEEHSHKLNADVKLTLDGKACQAADLKAGTRIRVSTQEGDKNVVTRIAGFGKNAEVTSDSHRGTLVSITGKKLVMTGRQGKEEQTCTMSDKVKITCDGEVCKASDLKPGMRIRVTLASAIPQDAVTVQAFTKNPNSSNR